MGRTIGSDLRSVRIPKAGAIVWIGLFAGLVAAAPCRVLAAAGSPRAQPATASAQQAVSVDDSIIAQLKSVLASQDTEIASLKSQISSLNLKVQDLDQKVAAAQTLQLKPETPPTPQWQFQGVNATGSSAPLSASGMDANDITYASAANADGMNQYSSTDTSALETEALLGGTGSLGNGPAAASHSSSDAAKKQTTPTTQSNTSSSSTQTTNSNSGANHNLAASLRRAFASSSGRSGGVLAASNAHVGASGAKLGLSVRSLGKAAKR